MPGMIHGATPQTLELKGWEIPWTGYQRVRAAYVRKHYTTVHSLAAPYDLNRYVIVQEVQNDITLACFWVCYVVGKQGGLFEVGARGCLRRISPHRIDFMLRAIPAEGLDFARCLADVGVVLEGGESHA